MSTPTISVTEAERGLVNALILRPQEFGREILSKIKKEYISNKKWRVFFSACQHIFLSGENPDLIALVEHLETAGELDSVGGIDAVASLTDRVGIDYNVSMCIGIVRRNWELHQLSKLANILARKTKGSNVDPHRLIQEAQHFLMELGVFDNDGEGLKHLRASVIASQRDIDKKRESRSRITGVSTGFRMLDDKTAGWQSTDFVIIAGRPSMGKTSFALNAIVHAGMAKKTVAFFSLEMSISQIVDRISSLMSQVDGYRIRTPYLLSHNDIHKLGEAFARIASDDFKVFVDDRAGLCPVDMKMALMELLLTEKKIDMVVIDYLQLMSPNPDEKTDSEQQNITSISKSIKGLAKEFNVPIIALSQLSRRPEKRENKKPELADLRGSGSLEQDADLVTFLFRKSYYEEIRGDEPDEEEIEAEPVDQRADVVELIIAKQRKGPIGLVKLGFRKDTGLFVNYLETA